VRARWPPTPHRETPRTADYVVRRRDQHQRLRIRARQNQRCGRGVGRIRFDQDNAGVHAAGIKLLGHQKSEIVAGNQHRRGKTRRGQPPSRHMEQTDVPSDAGELLWVGPARQRPKPGSRPAAQQQGINGHGFEGLSKGSRQGKLIVRLRSALYAPCQNSQPKFPPGARIIFTVIKLKHPCGPC